MISKATRSSSFPSTVGYVVGKEDSEVLEMRNLLIEDIDWRTAAGLMAATASQAHIERPAYHVSISWPEDEVPTDDQMRTVAARMLEELGLGEHQAVVVRHHDTAHAHVHIVVNRVHLLHGEEREDGTRNRVWKGWKDYEGLQKILRNLEREMGFRATPGRLHLQAELRVPGLEQRVGGGDAPTVLPQGVLLPTRTPPRCGGLTTGPVPARAPPGSSTGACRRPARAGLVRNMQWGRSMRPGRDFPATLVRPCDGIVRQSGRAMRVPPRACGGWRGLGAGAGWRR